MRKVSKLGLPAMVGFLVGIFAGIAATIYVQSVHAHGVAYSCFAQAISLEDKEQPMDAVFLLLQAQQWDRKWYAPYLQLGLIYEKEGYPELALQQFELAKHYIEFDKCPPSPHEGDLALIETRLSGKGEGEL